MADVVIRVEGLGKRYLLNRASVAGGGRFSYRRFSDVLVQGARRPWQWLRQRGAGASLAQRHDEFWALSDVSFEVKRGEVVGVIGRNGAGKSTLLKILSRITEPTRGRIDLDGTVASLLEVGTGFHPELTGRENIFLNGAILGMTRVEIRRKFDEIVAFAEIERFLDTPVKHYSSGMYVRLAFSVAAHLEPEILIVDEVLAVGDVAFQKKCLGKIGEVVSREGRTVLFVSHNMPAVRQMCTRAILLGRGRTVLDGTVEDAISTYLRNQSEPTSVEAITQMIATLPPDPVFRLRSVAVTQDGRHTTEVVSGKPIEVAIGYDVLEDTHDLHVYIQVWDAEGNMLFESLHNGDFEGAPSERRGRYLATVTIPADFLAGRTYELQIQAAIRRVREFFAKPLSIPLQVEQVGVVNRAYPGYRTPGRLAPLLPWTVKHDPL